MEKHVITHNGKDYIVNEPTIEQWIKLVGMKDWEDELEFGTRLIQEMTGLTKKEIQQSDWYNIISVSQNISNTILQQSKEFHKEFEFEGVKYRFIDLPNLTFGEFVDIDSILSKPDIERQRQIHVLMAMLYREVDDKGKLTEYDGSKIQDRSEKFKKLPVRYVNGATTFFFSYRKSITVQFPALFTEKIDDEIKGDLEALEYDDFSKFWGWFSTVVQLAQEDITKIDTIMKYPFVFVLNYLSYTKDLNNLREREQRKIEARNKRR